MVSWSVRTYEEWCYRVHETVDCLSPENELLASVAELHPGARRLVVMDRQVDALYGQRIRDYVSGWGADMWILTLPAGEGNKVLTTVYEVLDAADMIRLNRRSDPILAIGGGVVTDVVGLAASLYRRGTPFIRVPTTLIGLIDAGVGVKTGVNYHGHKNRLGTYYPSAGTILDRSFLHTLPVRHIRNGMAEAIKISIVCDGALFELLERHAAELIRTRFAIPAAAEVIMHAVGDMLAELEPNLREQDLRRLLDFGHTFSPGIEMASEGALLHGEAVAVDMALSTALALRRGIVDEGKAERIFGLLRQSGLPLHHPACTLAEAWAALEESRRHRDGALHCPLPSGLGHAQFVEDITRDDVASALALVAEKGSATREVG